MSNEIPFKQKYRQILPSMIDEVRNHLQQSLSANIIRRSNSPYASTVVLVKKKTGELRLCIYFRELDQRTIKDSFSLPRIDEILDSLSGYKYFSIYDMKSGYHQIEIEEKHKERTAFTVDPLEFYEYNQQNGFRVSKCTCYLSEAHETMPWRITPNSLLHILG